MSVNSVAFLKQGINIIKLAKYIKSKYNLIEYKANDYANSVFYTIYFIDNTDNSKRVLFIHIIFWDDEEHSYPTEVIKNTSCELSLSYWKNSAAILTDIVKHFGGGFILPDDSSFDGTGWQLVTPKDNTESNFTELESKVYKLILNSKEGTGFLNDNDIFLFNFIIKHINEIRQL